MAKVARKKTKIDDRTYWAKRHKAVLAEIIAEHPNAVTVQQRALCESLAWQLIDREKIEKRVGPTDDPLPESHATLCNVIRRGFDQLEGRAERPAPVEKQSRRVGRPSKDEAAYARYVEHCTHYRYDPESFADFLEDDLMYGRFIKPEEPEPTPARRAYLKATVPQPVEPDPEPTQQEQESRGGDPIVSPLTPEDFRRAIYGK